MGEETDGRRLIQMTVKLLSSINYPAPVVNILAAMYEDVNGHYTDRLPLAVFGGNIVTLVDLFCDSVPANDRLTLERFDAVKKRLRDLSGKLFFPELVEVFIAMVQEEILTGHTGGIGGQIMMYVPDEVKPQSLELRLRNEGFRTIRQNTPEEAFGLFQRCEPDVLVMILAGNENQITSRVEELSTWGIDFAHIPTFVLTEADRVERLTGLLERGIEDILAVDGNVDLLVTKIRKLLSKNATSHGIDTKEGDVATGAKGRLSDMNLIDLLQALGPGQKTVRITIKPESFDTEVLTIYLYQGAISFAAYKDFTGPDAVYEGLTWIEGQWTVEPVEPDTIPAPNNSISNEAILMEGCRLLDEQVKGGKLL
jgi:DNA-binding response OmpR family regulator